MTMRNMPLYNKPQTSALSGFCFLTIWACTWMHANAADRVYPKQGVPVSGKIVSITPAKITIEVRGKDQQFDVADLSKISFDKEPVELDRARQACLDGQYDQALDEVKKISVAGIKDVRVVQDVEFYRHYCEGKLGLAGSGDKNSAIVGLRAFAAANRNTHHKYSLSELLGELALAVGAPDKASGYFKFLATSPDAETQALGEYRLAEVELVLNQLSAAQERFEKLAKSPSKSPEMTRVKNLAQVGLAVCDNLAGDTEEALKRLNALIAKHDSTDQQLFARIYNAKGSCYERLDQTQQALLNYLKTDLLFFTEAEAHAEALYHLKQLWAKAGENSRAADAGSRLVSLYASSSWANK